MGHFALKVRIYPTQEQTVLINKTLGCCRRVYNIMLASRLDFYDKNIKDKGLSKTEKSEIYKSYKAPTEKELKQQYEYMKEVSSVALQQSRRDQEGAFTRFFKGLSKFPKFHSKKQKNSYREINVNGNCKFDWNHRIITLPKIRQVRFRNRELPKWLNTNDKICNITVSKNPSGQYYASILFEVEEQPKLKSENQAIGLDFSPANEYVDSNGLTGKDFGYIPQKQAHLKQLRKLERRLARKQKGSKNREKARLKVARMEQHIADSRKDWIEKETLRLVRNHNVIGIENLTTKGLLRASKNARNYVDTSWGAFTTKLFDKAKRFDCSVVKSDRFFASSKLCHVCGYKKTDLTLSTRHWICPVCHTEHNRDVNAALNLKLNAIKILSEGQEFRSVEGVEGMTELALVHSGASVETERDVSRGLSKSPCLNGGYFKTEQDTLKKIAAVICNDIGIGVSAESILAYCTGVKNSQMYPPADADDFKRCHNLLSAFPEWKEEIKDIGKTYKAWGTIGEHWKEIEGAYLKEDWKSVNQMLEKYSREN